MVTVFDKLPHAFTSLPRTVENPFFHSEKIEQLVLIFHHIQHIHIFADIQVEWHQHQETTIQEITRNDSVGVNQRINVQMFGPIEQQTFVGRKINRSNQGDEILNFLRIQCRINRREGSALADAHQIDLITLRYPSHDINAVVYVDIDIIIETKVHVGFVRVSPVDDEHIQAQIEQIPYHAAVRLKVKHILTVHQRINH